MERSKHQKMSNISAVVCDNCGQQIVSPMVRYKLDTPRGDLCSETCATAWVWMKESERVRLRVEAFKVSQTLVKDMQQRRVYGALPPTVTLKRVKTGEKDPADHPFFICYTNPTGDRVAWYRRV